jgi:predicted DsbA family dithiol-disulfide isomerase
VRLSAIEETYGSRVRVHWRAFPLIPGEQRDRRCTARTQEGRRRAGADEPRASFAPPVLGAELPASSMPALTAAKCAQAQGAAAFREFHRRLFAGHFEDNLDVARPDVLWRLAADAGLDMDRFRGDYGSGPAYQAALADYAEGAAWFGVSALPTAVFNEKVSLVGAVSEERYRLLLDWFLAGEPGGLIPLDRGPAEQAPGLSAVETSEHVPESSAAERSGRAPGSRLAERKETER